MDNCASTDHNMTEEPGGTLRDTVSAVSYFLITVLALWIVLSNALVVLAVATTRQLQRKIYFVMLSMSMAYLLTGIAVPVSFYFILVAPVLDNIFCAFLYISLIFPMIVSFIHMPLITVDRFIAVVYPLHYDIFLTIGRMRILIASVWIFSLLQSLVLLVWNGPLGDLKRCAFTIVPSWYKIMVLGAVWLGFSVLTCVLYIKIACVARAQETKVSTQLQLTSTLNYTSTIQSGLNTVGGMVKTYDSPPHHDQGMCSHSARPLQHGQVVCSHLTRPPHRDQVMCSHSPRPSHQGGSSQPAFKVERKATKVVALTLVIFLVTWGPLMIGTILYGYMGLEGEDTYELNLFQDIAVAIAFANSGLNVLVYAWKSAELRAAFIRLLCCCKKPSVSSFDCSSSRS